MLGSEEVIKPLGNEVHQGSLTPANAEELGKAFS